MPPFTMSSTLTPFLYQTRTLRRVARVRLARPAALGRGLHITHRRAHSEIPFQLPPDLDSSNPDMQDSITPTERQAFEQIFREIAEKGKKPKLPKADASPPEVKIAPEASRLIAALRLGSADVEQGAIGQKDGPIDVNSIMEHAAKRQEQTEPGSRGLDSLSLLDTTYSATEREKALLRFPPTLRRAARMAFGMFDAVSQPTVKVEGGQDQDLGTVPSGKEEADAVDRVSASLSSEQFAKTVQLEALRREERLRIKALMDASGNDFELWEVIEKEVFPLVERLGMGEPPPNPSFRPKRKGYIKGKRKAPVQDPPEIVTEEAKKTQSSALDMEIYGPVYPELLLESLELLDKKFARPSPYVTHLLPRIKQLGLVSYVLGVSTSFYNRLMSFLWHRHGDATGVLNLLEEMRYAGLFFDENSKSLLHDIERVYLQAENDEKGRFAAELMKMPEYEPILAERLHHWIGNVDRSIAERRAGLGF